MLTFCLSKSKIRLRNEGFNVHVRDSDLQPLLTVPFSRKEARLLNLKQQQLSYTLLQNSLTTHSDSRVYLLRGDKKKWF